MEKKKYRILIAEDDMDLLEQMTMFLENEGYEIISADNEKDAATIIRNQDFDIALLDLMLENSDSGFILSHKVKKKNPDIPVIIITAVTEETGFCFDTQSQANRQWIKADALINKDVRLEQVKREIKRFLKE